MILYVATGLPGWSFEFDSTTLTSKPASLSSVNLAPGDAISNLSARSSVVKVLPFPQ